MADNIDAMLSQGKETPAPASQASNGSQLDAPDTGEPTEEEVEFNKLTGSTQERIRKLVGDKKALLEEVEGYKNAMRTVPPPPPSGNEPNPDVQQAVQKLDAVGLATKDYTDQRIGQSLQILRYEQEMARLASTYTGKDGEPQFDRSEYEDFVRDNPVYANYYPEDVFRDKMFRDEFHNLEGEKPESVSPKTLRPTKTSQPKETFTPEYIEEKLKSLPPEEKKQWYQDNLAEINATLGKMNPNA
jgi:hypothetical protein